MQFLFLWFMINLKSERIGFYYLPPLLSPSTYYLPPLPANT